MTKRGVAEVPRKSYNHPCLIAQTLDILGDRWTLLIIRDLMTGLHRYSDILESCGGMSPNILSSRLKHLEAEGLVERHYERGLPPRVEYTLTEKGWAARPVLLALLDWGVQYANRYDVEAVGTDIPTDFFVRVTPTFAFHPERAHDMDATIVVEIKDCEGCRSWSFHIKDGYLYPLREAITAPDVILRTDTRGFLQFFRGHAAPVDCGELEGCEDTARSIQECFSPTGATI